MFILFCFKSYLLFALIKNALVKFKLFFPTKMFSIIINTDQYETLYSDDCFSSDPVTGDVQEDSEVINNCVNVAEFFNCESRIRYK